MLTPRAPGLAAAVDAFGRDVLATDGSLDRARLAARVLDAEAARDRLNAIVHPLGRFGAAKRFATAPADAIIVNDVPPLVESGLAASYDVVVVVEAPLQLRLSRLVRRGMTEDDARARINAQVSDQERRAAADIVVVNDESLPGLDSRVQALWTTLSGRLASSS